MYSKKLVRILFIFLVVNASALAESLGPISEVGSSRIENNVLRYIKTFNDNCLEIQIISPDKNWEVLIKSNFCTFEGKNFSSDFADAGFENIHIKEDGVHTTLSITPLQPTGEQRRKCVIKATGTTINGLECSELIK